MKLVVKNVRCTYPKLFVAEEYMGKKTFSIGLMIPAEGDKNLAALEHACLEVAEAKYPGKGMAMLKKFKGSRQTYPIKELDDGNFIITPKRREDQGAPLVVDGQKRNIPAAANKPYAGCYVNASIDVYCYTKNGGGITCYLNGVQFVKDGEPLGAGATASSCKDDFDELETPTAEVVPADDGADLI